jgi:hypothetical protein
MSLSVVPYHAPLCLAPQTRLDPLREALPPTQFPLLPLPRRKGQPLLKHRHRVEVISVSQTARIKAVGAAKPARGLDHISLLWFVLRVIVYPR